MQYFSCEKVLVKHIKICRKVSDKQNVKLINGLIKFNNISYQLAVSFKIYADGNASFTKKYQEHIPCRFAYKNVCIDDRFRKPVVLYKGKNLVHKFITRNLNRYEYCIGVAIKHFNKNLVMTVDVEKNFKLSNKCWI